MLALVERGADDRAWIAALAQQSGGSAVISGDRRMLTRNHELQALKDRRVTSFILAAGWSSLAFGIRPHSSRHAGRPSRRRPRFGRRLDFCCAAPAPRRPFAGAVKGKKPAEGGDDLAGWALPPFRAEQTRNTDLATINPTSTPPDASACRSPPIGIGESGGGVGGSASRLGAECGNLRR